MYFPTVIMYCIRSKSLFFLFKYKTASETWHTQLRPGVKPVDLCIFPCFIQCLNCHYPNKMTVMFTVLFRVKSCIHMCLSVGNVFLCWHKGFWSTFDKLCYTDDNCWPRITDQHTQMNFSFAEPRWRIWANLVFVTGMTL